MNSWLNCRDHEAGTEQRLNAGWRGVAGSVVDMNLSGVPNQTNFDLFFSLDMPT